MADPSDSIDDLAAPNAPKAGTENSTEDLAPPQGAPYEEPSFAPNAGPGQVAFNRASDVVRPILRGAAQVYGFLGPDELTFLWNQIPGTHKEMLPSDYWQKQIDRFTAKPTGKLAKDVENVSSAVAGGALGGGLGSLLDEGGNLAVRSLRAFLGSPESHPTYSAKQLVKARNAKQVTEAGYKLPPEWIGGRVTKAVQGLMSKARVTRNFAAANEEVTDNLAKRAIGLNDLNALDERTLSEEREEAYKAYDGLRAIGPLYTDHNYLLAIRDAGDRFLGIQGADAGLATGGAGSRGATVAGRWAEPLGGSQLKDLKEAYGGELPKGLKLPDKSQLSEIAEKVQAEKAPYLAGRFTAAWALDQIKALRAAARANLVKYDPVNNAVGATQREIAQALEDQLTRAAQEKSADNPALASVMTNFLKAREQLAKIRVVSDAMGPNGHVDAHAIGAIEKKNPGYLTGPLHTIAVAANNFPDAVALSRKGAEGGWSRVDFLFGGTGFALHNPVVVGLGVVTPAVTAALKSEPVQRSMVRGLERAAAAGGDKKPGVLRSLARGVGRGAVAEGTGAGLSDDTQ